MIVAIDTSALSFLLDLDLPEEPSEALRWQNVRDSVMRWQDAGATLIIPAPVLAELAATPGAADIAGVLARRFPDLDVRPLDSPAAIIAGAITQPTLTKPPRTEPRPVVKFDALILATAVRWGATKLATTDGRDFNKFVPGLAPERDVWKQVLPITYRPIEIVLADETPRGAQVAMIGSR